MLACHTLRGCVDWNIIKTGIEYEKKVTPYVGVWIETLVKITQIRCELVTPYVGVWIETWASFQHLSMARSHPTWVCGLKLNIHFRKILIISHTLRGCVDWNVIGNGSLISILCHTLRGCVDWNNDEVNTCIDNQSHPTWVCGLKHPHVIVFKTIVKSHPTWVCGLKPPVPCYVPKV